MAEDTHIHTLLCFHHIREFYIDLDEYTVTLNYDKYCLHLNLHPNVNLNIPFPKLLIMQIHFVPSKG